MIVIRQEQMLAFEQAAGKRFLREMVEHIKPMSLQLCAVVGDEKIHLAVAQAINKAADYNLTLRGSVRLYIELSFLLGSGFDTDPQHPEFHHQLTCPDDEMHRAEALYSYVQAYEASVLGADQHQHKQAALVQFAELAAQPFSLKAASFEQHMLQELMALFLQKANYVGTVGLQALIKHSLQRAMDYGLPNAESQAIFTRLTFLLGHDCAQDPLYSWIAQILKQANTKPTVIAHNLQGQALCLFDKLSFRELPHTEQGVQR